LLHSLLPDYLPEQRKMYYFPRVIHQLVYGSFERGDAQLQQLRNRLTGSGTLARAWSYLDRSRTANPLQPQIHLMMAQLSGLFQEPEADRLHLENTLRTINASYSALFTLEHVARAHADAGRVGLASGTWARYLRNRADLKSATDRIEAFVQFMLQYQLDPLAIGRVVSVEPIIVTELALHLRNQSPERLPSQTG